MHLFDYRWFSEMLREDADASLIEQSISLVIGHDIYYAIFDCPFLYVNSILMIFSIATERKKKYYRRNGLRPIHVFGLRDIYSINTKF